MARFLGSVQRRRTFISFPLGLPLVVDASMVLPEASTLGVQSGLPHSIAPMSIKYPVVTEQESAEVPPSWMLAKAILG